MNATTKTSRPERFVPATYKVCADPAGWRGWYWATPEVYQGQIVTVSYTEGPHNDFAPGHGSMYRMRFDRSDRTRTFEKRVSKARWVKA